MKSNVIRRVWAWIMVACMLFTMVPTGFAEDAVDVPADEPAVTETASEVAEDPVEPAEQAAPEAEEPTEEPTAEPTAKPTAEPTAEPTVEPTEEPVADVPVADEPSFEDVSEVPARKAYTLMEAYQMIVLEKSVTALDWSGGEKACPVHTDEKNLTDSTKIKTETRIPADCANKRNGLKSYTCLTCGAVAYEQVAFEHTFTKKLSVKSGDETKHCGQDVTYNSTCDVCGAEGELVEKATGKHDFEAKTVDEGSCIAKPQLQMTCKNCGATDGNKFEDVSAPEPHHHWVKDGNWECSTSGVTQKYKCDNPNCPGNPEGKHNGQDGATGENTLDGDKKQAIKEVTDVKTDHKFSEGTYRAPTCTQDGGTVQVCEVCGKEQIADKKDKLGHKTDGEWYPVEDTHGEDHYETQICKNANCPGFAADDTTHYRKCSTQKDSWNVTPNAATCKTVASTTYECKTCGYKETIDGQDPKLDPTTHKFDPNYSGNITPAGMEATCSKPGVQRLVCTLCGELGEYVQVESSHDWGESLADNPNKPTCNSAGTEIYVCQRPGCPGFVSGKDTAKPEKLTGNYDYVETGADGKAHRVKAVPKTQHSYNKINNGGHFPEVPDEHKDPTCIEDGYNLYICKWCDEDTPGHTHTEILEAGPQYHKPGTKDEVVEATCNLPSMVGKKCSICGKIVADAKPVHGSEPLGHLWHLTNPEDKPATCKEKWTRTYVCMRSECDGIGEHGDDVWDDDHSCYKYEMYNGETDYELNHMLCSTGINKDGTVYAEYTDDTWNNGNAEDPGEHKWSEDKQQVPADCTHPERKVPVCEICGAYDEDQVEEVEGGKPALGHAYGDWEEGWEDNDFNWKHWHVRYCTRKGCEFSRDAKEWTEDVESEPGEGNVQYHDGEADLAGEGEYVEDTCLLPEHTHYQCLEPGDWCDWEYDYVTPGVEKDWVPSEHHNHLIKQQKWEDPANKPTCSQPGKGKWICDVCGKPYGDDIEIPGHHNWVEYTGEYDGKVSCTAAGKLRYVCANEGCSNTVTSEDKEADDEGHTVTYTKVGKVLYKDVAYTAKLGHTFGEVEDPQGEPDSYEKETCSKDGKKTWTCTRCGETAEKTIDATGKHTPDYDRPELVQADCVHNSYMTYRCSVCGEIIESGDCVIQLTNPEAKATGHKFDVANKYAPAGADCDDGFTWIIPCSNPNCPGYDATWDGTEGKLSNGEANGKIETGTYKGRAYKNGDVVAAHSDHVAKAGTSHTVTEATCTEGTGTWATCENCGKSFETGEDGEPALGHQFWTDSADEGKDKNYGWVKDPDGKDGKEHSHIRTCLREGCGYIEHEADLSGDDLSKFNSIKGWNESTIDANCTEPEKTEYTCKICGEKYVETTGDEKGTEHVFTDQSDDETPIPPTCTKPGVKREVCDKCGAYGDYYQVEASHIWGEGVVTTPATCTEAGVTTYFCTNENCPLKDDLTQENVWKENDEHKGLAYKQDTTIPAKTGHSYEKEGDPSAKGVVTKAATCTEAGETTYTCTWCEAGEDNPTHTKVDKTIPEALGHNYVDNELFAGDCENAGRQGGQTCTRCHQANPAKPGSPIGEAFGHYFVLQETVDEHDCTKAVVKTYVCATDGCPGWIAANHSTETAGKGALPTNGTVPSDLKAEGADETFDKIEYSTNEDGQATMTITFKTSEHDKLGGMSAPIDPDCVHGMIIETYCSKCGKVSETKDFKDDANFNHDPNYLPLGHLWVDEDGDGEEDEDAAEAHNGWKPMEGDAYKNDKHEHYRICVRPGCTYGEDGGPKMETGKPTAGTESGVNQKWTETEVPANCKEGAKTKYTCPTCGYSYTVDTPDSKPSGVHVFTDEATAKNDEITIAPTCTKPGVGRQVCDVCGAAYGNYYQIDGGHLFTKKIGDPIPADCLHKERQLYECTRENCPGDGKNTPARSEIEDPKGKLGNHTPVQSMQSDWVYTFCTVCGTVLDKDADGKEYSNSLFKSATADKLGTCIKRKGEEDKVDTADGKSKHTGLQWDPATATLTAGWYCKDCKQILTGHIAKASCTHENIDNSKPSDDLVSKATCVAKAKYNYVCPECGATVAKECGNVDLVTGHDYVATTTAEGAIATYDQTKRTAHTDGNCVDAESSTYTCTLCQPTVSGHSVTITGKTNPANHKSEAAREAVAATCTAKGHEAGNYCSACNNWTSGNETKAIGHKWNRTPDYQSPDPADASHMVDVFVCQNDNCPGYDAAIEATDYLDPMPEGYHRAMGSDTASHTGRATYWQAHVDCDHAALDAKIAAPDYDPETDPDGKAELVTAATCVTAAQYNVVCPTCGYPFQRSVGKPDTVNGHKYDDGTPDAQRPATCTEKGYTIYTCQNEGCKDANAEAGYTKEERNIDALGHEWPASKDAEGSALKTAATCVSGAIYTYTCQRQDCPGYKAEPTEGWENGDATGQTEEGHKATKEVNDNTPDLVNGHKFGDWKDAPEQADATNIHVHTGACQNEGCNSNDGQPATKTVKFTISDASDTFTVEKTDATCEKGSFYTFNCTECNAKGTTTPAEDKAPHSWAVEGFDKNSAANQTEGNGWNVGQAATCIADGYGTYTCTNSETCQAVSEHVTLTATGHNFTDKAEQPDVNANCVHGNIFKYSCSNANCAYDAEASDKKGADGVQDGKAYKLQDDGNKNTATGHNFAEYTSTTEGVDGDIIHVHKSTCANEGCDSNDGQPAEDVVEFKASDNGKDGFTVETHEATCENGTYYTYSCTTCGAQDVDTEEADDKLKHSFEAFSEDELKLAENQIEANGWAYLDGQEPTCIAGGKGQYTCTQCKTAKSAEIDAEALGHDWDDGVTTDADCVTPGDTTYTCQREGCPGYQGEDGEPDEWDATQNNDQNVAQKVTKGQTNPSNHKGPFQTLDAEQATCTAAGKTQGQKCQACGQDSVPQTEIPALGHAWAREDNTFTALSQAEMNANATQENADQHWKWTRDSEADCTDAGSGHYTCLFCNSEEDADIRKETITALGHDFEGGTVVPMQSATCMEKGHQAGKQCSRCEEWDDAAKTEIEIDLVNGHKYSETPDPEKSTAPTCTKAGENVYVCELCEGEKDNGTTTEPGDPALGHTWDRDDFNDKDFSVENGWVSVIDATCVDEGEGYFTCTECEEEDNNSATVTTDINPDNHSVNARQSKERVDATCTEAGTEAGEYCNDCEQWISGGAEIPAKKHTWERTTFQHTPSNDPDEDAGWTVQTKATCDQPGNGTYTCLDCHEAGNTKTAAIPQLNADGLHSWERDDFDIENPENQTDDNGWVLDADAATGHYECTDCGAHSDSVSVGSEPLPTSARVNKLAVMCAEPNGTSSVTQLVYEDTIVTITGEPTNDYYPVQLPNDGTYSGTLTGYMYVSYLDLIYADAE